ncbi:MAG: hypothetical protein IPL65_22085 [Lewinellaceae bacterium]|nr:hypothetical protein [Lewinellaceae bacterium]
MLRRIYFTSLFLCSLTTAALAQQEPHPCGTTGYSPWLKWYQDNKSEVQERGGADTTWLYVPVTIHIVGTNSGVGYYPQDQAFRIICEMNGQYEAAHILFTCILANPLFIITIPAGTSTTGRVVPT